MKKILIFIILFQSCGEQSNPVIESVCDSTVIEDNLDRNLKLSENDIWKSRSYKYFETRMKKLALINIPEIDSSLEIELYRFEYSHSFQLDKIVIEIQSKEQKYSLRHIVFNEERQCNPIIGTKEITEDCFSIIQQKHRRIEKKEWNKFKTIIIENEIWDLKNRDNRTGTDGSLWSIEAIKNIDTFENKDVINSMKITRWSPPKYMGIRKVGEYLIKIAGLDKNFYHEEDY